MISLRARSLKDTGSHSVAIVLAAGVGKRLQPLTLDTPKSLVRIRGLPIIIHQLRAFEACGIRKVVVVLGYKSAAVKKVLLSSVQKTSVEIIENSDYEKTNNLFSLYLASKFLEQSFWFNNYGRVVLANGDIVFDKLILADMLQNDRNQIAVDIGKYNDESMKIMVNNANHVVKISKEIPEANAFGISIDIYNFSRDSWNDFKFVVSNMIEKSCLKNVWTEHAIQRFLDEAKHEFFPLDIKGRYWFEIDTFEDLKEAERRFTFFQKAHSLMGKELFIFDLDGTILLGNSVLPNAIKCIKALLEMGKIVVFLTNNSAFSGQEHLERLTRLLGIKFCDDNIHTSVRDTINYLGSKKIRRIFLLATPSVMEEFSNSGLILNADQAEAVVVAFDKTLSYNKLERASHLLEKKNNLVFVLTNRDMKCPTESGFIPDAGSIGKLLELTTDRKIDVCRGKPNCEMITDVISKCKLSKEKCVFFGDRLYTDIEMGNQSGVMTVLILTGETKLADIDLPFLHKHLVVADLNELFELTQRD